MVSQEGKKLVIRFAWLPTRTNAGNTVWFKNYLKEVE